MTDLEQPVPRRVTERLRDMRFLCMVLLGMGLISAGIDKPTDLDQIRRRPDFSEDSTVPLRKFALH